MLSRDLIVEVLVWAMMVVGILAFASAGFVAARIVRRAEPRDRRRHLLAGLAVSASPVFFAGLARSLMWLSEWSGSAMFGLDDVWLALGNLLPAMAGSAAAAFVLPFRSPRERGFALLGGPIVGFAVFWVALGLFAPEL